LLFHLPLGPTCENCLLLSKTKWNRIIMPEKAIFQLKIF
jgi:hypothetical protein